MEAWFAEGDALDVPNPNAMCLSTVSADGQVSGVTGLDGFMETIDGDNATSVHQPRGLGQGPSHGAYHQPQKPVGRKDLAD